MKYVLEKLEEIITVLLKPRNVIQQKDPLSFVTDYYYIAEAEIQNVKHQLLLNCISSEHDNRIILYIRQHQLALVGLSDMVFGFQSRQVADNVYTFPELSSVTTFYISMQYAIDQLLQFLRTTFGKYFDLNARLDNYRKHHYALHLKQFIKSAGHILHHHNIDKDLVDIIIQPLKDYCTAAEVSFARHDFTRKLEQVIAGLKGRANVTNTAVCLLLIELNYNAMLFQDYYINYLQKGSRDYDSPVEFYYLQLKLINQVPQVPNPVYDQTRPPIRELIGTWLAEEIYFIEKKQQFIKTTEVNYPEPGHEQKIHTSLSVAHLSLAVKLLIDSKVIKNKNSTELMKLVARNFKTDTREQISEDSLRNKSYSYDERTVDQVKDLVKGLMGMVMRY